MGGRGRGRGEPLHLNWDLPVGNNSACVKQVPQWPAHSVTTRDRFHCIEKWPAHTVTGSREVACSYSDH